MKFTTLSDVVVVVLLLLSTGDVVDLITADSVLVKVPDFGDIYGIQSYEDGTQVDEFLGIPYADPPVGDRRFRPPQPFKPKKGWTFNATTPPQTCYQTPDDTFDKTYVEMWNPNTNLSEDCLYLNIWRPTTPAPSGQKRAVMVWIYGGGFSTGSSTLDVYDGKYLASHGDVILVSMQYRVGPLGFLALDKDSGVAGNAGLLDQQAALNWVRQHIESFGGDPARVTIFGESAGAASVSYHLLSPGSKQLFRGAILQSAAVGGKWNFLDWDDAVQKGLDLAKLVGCPTSGKRSETVACLRKKSAADLTNNQFNVKVDGPPVSSAFLPTVDGVFINRNPEDIIKNNMFHDKNILLGANHDEGSYFMLYMFKSIFNVSENRAKQIDQGTFTQLFKSLKLVDDDADDDDDDDDDDDEDDDVDDAVEDLVLFEYGTPSADGGSSSFSLTVALENLMGDFLFKCPVVRFADAYVKDNQSVYLYSFNHRTSGNPWPAWTGAAHGYEIDHVFGVPSQSEHKSKYKNEERTLSNQMMTYWTNFAKSGNPNTGGTSLATTIPWPQYTSNSRSVLVLNTGNLTVQEGLRKRQCRFWSDIVPKLEKTCAASGAEWYRSRHLSILLTLLVAGVSVAFRT